MKAGEVLEISLAARALEWYIKEIPGAMCELIDMLLDNGADCCRIRLKRIHHSR
jgi:hypothetical protein